jgi:hypothetical protein
VLLWGLWFYYKLKFLVKTICYLSKECKASLVYGIGCPVVCICEAYKPLRLAWENLIHIPLLTEKKKNSKLTSKYYFRIKQTAAVLHSCNEDNVLVALSKYWKG